MEEELKQTQPTTEETPANIEEIVKQLFDSGMEVEEINQALQKMFDEQKISADELKQGVELISKMDKELASKQFGVDIL